MSKQLAIVLCVFFGIAASLAGQMQWGLSSIKQGENSGTITHELGHYAFDIGDNNNNPYKEPYRRVGSGPWDMMDRGCFNGP